MDEERQKQKTVVLGCFVTTVLFGVLFFLYVWVSWSDLMYWLFPRGG